MGRRSSVRLKRELNTSSASSILSVAKFMMALGGPPPISLVRAMVENWEAELGRMQYDRVDCVAVWIKGVLGMEAIGIGAMDVDLKTWAETVNAAWPNPGPPDIPRIEEALGPRGELESRMRRMIVDLRRDAGMPGL